MDNSGWLSDEPDKKEGTETKPEGKEARIAAVARMADENEKLLKNTSVENLTQELGTVNTTYTEQEVALKQFEQENVEDT
ncbi:hypothetical protein CsSME_00019804 [Camellia sinensis var. sinensis]